MLSVKKNDFPFTGLIFRSGSETLIKSKLNSFNPEKTESTINKAIVPTITPIAAIRVMILMALLLLLENKYRFAMYRGNFKCLFIMFYYGNI